MNLQWTRPITTIWQVQRNQLTLNAYNNIQIVQQKNEFTLNAQKKNQFNRSERINYYWVRPMQPIWKAEKMNLHWKLLIATDASIQK